MKPFEKELSKSFKQESIPQPSPEQIWSRIQAAQAGPRQINHRRNPSAMLRKWVIAAVLILAVSIGVQSYGERIAHAASTLFKQVFGSIESARQLDPHADEQLVEKELQAAQQALTDVEFQQYISLMQELTNLIQKAVEVVNGEQIVHMERLTDVEKTRLGKLEGEITALTAKIDRHYIYSMQDAAPMKAFPVKQPEYIPSGYKLVKEEVKDHNPGGISEPIASFTYQHGEFGFIVRISGILSGETEEYSLRNIEKEEVYKLQGNQVRYGRIGKNVTAMKMVVPEKGSQPTYQIYIIADMLTKEDVEKIALSIAD
jgi:bla regulator protein blaR1